MKKNKVSSRTDLCGAKIMLAALRYLAGVEGGSSISDVRAYIAANCQLDEWECAVTKSGTQRWQNILTYDFSTYRVAGLIDKNKSHWYITEDGLGRLSSDSATLATDLLEYAAEAYDKTRAVDDGACGGAALGGEAVSVIGSCSCGGGASDAVVEDVVVSKNAINLDELFDRSSAGFSEYIRALSPYEFQDLVAALLRAMGFFTPFVAPRGRDGGIDVLAFSDPLGSTSPRLKVQVKHYPSTPISVDVVRQMSGLLTKEGDAGVVVTSGTFTNDALRVARESHRFLRLVDGVEFVELWLKYYEKMSDEDKALMPVCLVPFICKN